VVAIQGDRSVAGFDRTLKEGVQRFLDLRAKAAAGDATAQIEFALLEGDLGRIKFDELSKRLEGKALSDSQKEALKSVQAGAVLAEAKAALNNGRGSKEAWGIAGKMLADAYAAGLMPAAAERKQEFCAILLQYALNVQKDADLAQRALDDLKPLLEAMGADNPQVGKWLRVQEDKIAELRAQEKEGGCGDEGIEEGCG
jgi:hypothetical protein